MITVLQNLHKLRELKPIFEGIRIKRDMTPLEREEYGRLVKIRNERQQEADDKGEDKEWVIWRGQVIQKTRQSLNKKTSSRVFRPSPAPFSGQTEAQEGAKSENRKGGIMARNNKVMAIANIMTAQEAKVTMNINQGSNGVEPDTSWHRCH